MQGNWNSTFLFVHPHGVRGEEFITRMLVVDYKTFLFSFRSYITAADAKVKTDLKSSYLTQLDKKRLTMCKQELVRKPEIHAISTHSNLHQQSSILFKVLTDAVVHPVCVWMLQDSIIEEVRALWERRRKAGGLKEMLQDVTKLTKKLCFLVEEVWHWAWLY